MVNLLENAAWLRAPWNGDVPPVFRKEFNIQDKIVKAELTVTAMGIYEAEINGVRVGKDLFAPGWTEYKKRLQYQTYDVTELFKSGDNVLDITVANGWCIGEVSYEGRRNLWGTHPELIAALEIETSDGETMILYSDEDWQVGKGPVRMSEFFAGEDYDARIGKSEFAPPVITERGYDNLIPQEGPPVRVTETLEVKDLIITPKGETVLDFGQNMSGIIEFEITAKSGDEIEISHAEILDAQGNFYNENYRTAAAKINYICKDGAQTYRPHFMFQGFRYIRLDKWPTPVKSIEDVKSIRAHVVHSDMERTGFFECSDSEVNKLFSNIIWGQRDNFLEVPTDCPQRNERCGWTGDAQVFIRTASYNYNVEKFFTKWLNDLKASQMPNGAVPLVIPDVVYDKEPASAWSDAAVICPWQLYVTYGNPEILRNQFDSMKNWVEYIRAQGDNEYLWEQGRQYGDWCALDAPCPWHEISKESAQSGATYPYLVSSAYYAYSTKLLIKAGHALGKDMSEYEALYSNIRKAYKEKYIPNGEIISNTQTAWVLSLYFDLVDDKAHATAQLAELIRKAGNTLTTGFIGTPYLLHVLSDNGYTELAYTLLLRREYPSWLYPVSKGATTIWERWDGIAPDGSLNDASNCSFNHYAYGAVGDWLYQTAAGIAPCEDAPGFKHIIFAPKPDSRLDYCKASIDTKHGTVTGGWKREYGSIHYELIIPEGCSATLHLNNTTEKVEAGTHRRSFSN